MARTKRSASQAVAIAPKAEVMAVGGLEGAERTTRETLLWNASRLSPDQIINRVKEDADNRGRETVTNDGYGQGFVDTNRDQIVGSQYRLNARPNWQVLQRLDSRLDETWATEFQEFIEELFNLIGESTRCYLDAGRRLTFTQMVRMAIGTFCYTGESLSTVEWIRDTDRPFNTAILQISPSRLSNPNTRADDAQLRRGISQDFRGKPMGYFIQDAYPTEAFYGNGQDAFHWTYVAAQKPWGRRMVLHITDPMQPGQSRGISNLVAVLKEMRMTKKFRDITLQNAVINASYAATIESELPSEVIAAAMGQGSTGDASGAFLGFVGSWMSKLSDFLSQTNAIAVDGAKIPHLFPGTKLNTKNLGTPGGIGTEYEVSMLRYIAAGLGISYEELAQDFSKTNYSSARASMLTTWKHMMARKTIVADKFASMVYELILEEFLNAGRLPMPAGIDPSFFYENGVIGIPFMALAQCDWIGAGRGQIDELKETQAALLRIKGGLSTYELEIAKMGNDWRKIFRQRYREMLLAGELGLQFESDSTTGQEATGGGNPAGPTQDQLDQQERDEQNGAIDRSEQLTQTVFDGVTKLLASVHPPQPPQPPQPPSTEPRTEVTRITKMDDEGRVLEFERNYV